MDESEHSSLRPPTPARLPTEGVVDSICTHCGYCVAGLPDVGEPRCPECGRAVPARQLAVGGFAPPDTVFGIGVLRIAVAVGVAALVRLYLWPVSNDLAHGRFSYVSIALVAVAVGLIAYVKRHRWLPGGRRPKPAAPDDRVWVDRVLGKSVRCRLQLDPGGYTFISPGFRQQQRWARTHKVVVKAEAERVRLEIFTGSRPALLEYPGSPADASALVGQIRALFGLAAVAQQPIPTLKAYGLLEDQVVPPDPEAI